MSDGYVYVAECNGYFKIGYARDSPRKRVRSMSTGNPFPVVLIGAIEGSREVEAEWHQVFASKKVRGEWFELTREDVARVLHENIGIDQFE